MKRILDIKSNIKTVRRDCGSINDKNLNKNVKRY